MSFVLPLTPKIIIPNLIKKKILRINICFRHSHILDPFIRDGQRKVHNKAKFNLSIAQRPKSGKMLLNIILCL